MLIINDVSHNTAETGRFATTTRGGTLTVTNGYNLRGWLTSIESTPFREYLYYEQPHNGSTAQYGGNISSMDWKTGDNILRGYTFQYDGLSRLTGAAYSENGSASTHYGTSYQYDLMGNITGLTRSGLQDDNSYGLIDNLSFDYNGNQLLKVTDAVTSGPNYSGAFHFNDHSDVSQEYEYDLNGNMTKDLNKKITSVEYNVLNLPEKITFASDSILYEYAADGRKVKVKYPYTFHPFPPVIHIELGMEEITGGVIHDPRLGIIELARPSHDYSHCGNLVYYDSNIDNILVEGGFITYDYNSNEPIYHYCLADHLGNTRVVVNEDGTTEQEDHYYPYGTIFGESEDYGGCKYMYNGKEIDRMHGLYWYDYGARHYDAAIVSWPTMDPLAEKYYSLSPYAYCGDNPVRFVDPNGEVWTDFDGNKLDNTEDIKVFIFYSADFADQARVQYNEAISLYGEGSVALSLTSTEREFATDWENMGGTNIQIVMILTHGKNQSITLDEEGHQQLTSTGNGKTNISKSEATNVQDLPTPKGNISNAVLNMYSCHSADKTHQKHGTQGELSGSKDPIAYAFAKKFNFRGVIGTAESVNYHSFFTDGTPLWSNNYLKPYPANGGKWTYIKKR